MHLDQILAEFSVWAKQLVVSRYPTASSYYVFALFALTLAFLFAMPVGSADTDLWYHLNGGRLLWEFSEFPDSAFYSFMDTARSWTNYFWGFQALSYQVHHYFGYEGLILLRVLLVGAAFVSISAILIRPQDGLTQRTWALMLLVLVLLVLVGRTAQIRPHLVSYCMITLFLLILERRPNWLPTLPVLTVIWVNLHGVEWPIGALICGAYFLENAWQWYRGDATQRAVHRRVLLWTAACLPALFVNPFGVQMLLAPFSTPSDVYIYIGELKPYPLWALFSVSLTGPVISVAGAVALLNWGNVLAYGFLFIRRRLRFTPLILSIAGIILLSRGTRFVWEWLLLSLPLWRSAIDALPKTSAGSTEPGLRAVNILVLIILLSPLFSWLLQIKGFQQWPLDSSKLPVGTTGFLVQQEVSGRLLVSPNPGGYLAWRLYPDILISGDMQTPPTTPWDHYRRNMTLKDADALRRFIEEYRPNLIAIELTHKNSRKLFDQHASYRPVFFDDHLALYADADQLPELVARHELRHVNPFNLLDKELGTIDERLAELKTVLSHHPDGDRVQHAITRLLFNEKHYAEALPYAQRFVETVPDNPNSHFLLGNVLENLDRCDEATEHYLNAFEHSPADFHPTLHKHLGSCAYLDQDFGAAYRHFKKGVNAYQKQEAAEHLYQYAVSAVAVGDDETARTLLHQLLYAAPMEDDDVTRRARGLLADL